MDQSKNTKDQSIAKTIGFLRSNRPLRAEELCRDYLIQKPGCTEHLRLLSHALMKQNRYLEAEEKLRFAISLSPDYPQLHEDLGSVFAMQSRYDEAIPEFERAIQLQPSLPLVHKKLGHALAAVGRGKEANDGSLLDPNIPSSRVINVSKRAGTPTAIHTLRHTHISNLLNNGVNIFLVSKRAGHYNISTTVDVYGHLFTSVDDDLIQQLETKIRASWE